VIAAALLSACGDESSDKQPATTARPAQAKRAPIPAALSAAGSASEDTIDLALAGKRVQVVKKARALKAIAAGPLIAEVRKAGADEAVIADFRKTAGRVASLAPRGDLLQVALASNHAFGDVAEFFALFESPVPADVTRLDFLDFEAKLRAKAGQGGPLHGAVIALANTWAKLRPAFVKAGGGKVAPQFDAHVAEMRRLAPTGDRAATAREAQHGLDLVDKLEEVYEG
jgi:hypothetical protein